MAYDKKVAERIRELLADVEGVREHKMFGGLSFLVDDHMCCGLTGDDLVVRVGPDAYEEALALPHARKMDLTHRPLRGFVYVAPAGVESDEDLAAWVGRGVAYARSLPPKKKKKKRESAR